MRIKGAQEKISDGMEVSGNFMEEFKCRNSGIFSVRVGIETANGR